MSLCCVHRSPEVLARVSHTPFGKDETWLGAALGSEPLWWSSPGAVWVASGLQGAAWPATQRAEKELSFCLKIICSIKTIL